MRLKIISVAFGAAIALSSVGAAFADAAHVPANKAQCKDGGWEHLHDNASPHNHFKNQGDCVSFVATGGTNLGAGDPHPHPHPHH